VVTDPVLSGNPARESAVGVTTIRRAELADDETSMTAACRLRIGDWRVIFIEDARSITVIAVGNRREIYD